jgi:hypothetical protein
MSKPLSVADGAVVIACVEHPDKLAKLGWPSLVDCTIHPIRGASLPRSGHFVLAKEGGSLGFDPAATDAYATWDGCSIQLRDGRALEEMTIIHAYN